MASSNAKPVVANSRRGARCVVLWPSRSGLTLIEMMIAVALTLLLVFALVRVFQMLGDNVRDTKAILEMSGQLRIAMNQLQEDLDSRTVTVRSHVDPQSAQGYFELVEGIATDRDIDGDGQFLQDNSDDLLNLMRPSATFTQVDLLNRQDADYHPAPNPPRFAMTTKGDRDDVLMFTARTSGKPFVGQLVGSLVFVGATNRWNFTHVPGGDRHTIESQEAEIVWWSEPDELGNWHIYRRVLLIRPDIDIVVDPNNGLVEFQFMQDNDLSVRLVTTTDPKTAAANSLADLSLRENRYAHLGQFGEGPNHFPFPLLLNRIRMLNPASRFVDNARRSEYLAVADTLAFDVKAFDPQAPLQIPLGGALVVAPSDPAYDPIVGPTTMRGAYVDLNYSYQPNLPESNTNPIDSLSEFSGRPLIKSGLLFGPNSGIRGVYDTWPQRYERDGIAQRNGKRVPNGPNVVIDQGTDGFDNDGVNGVDDSGEAETSPPYPADLRGIEVTVRVFEFNTRQVRQSSMVADFTEGLGP